MNDQAADTNNDQTPDTSNIIQYDDFTKLELKVGTVLEVTDHPNADRLLVLQVDLGSEKRQIIAGLKGYCSHEQLMGAQVIVVANLAPRKMRGMESQGMLLAASWEEGEGDDKTRRVVPMTAGLPVPAGSEVS